MTKPDVPMIERRYILGGREVRVLIRAPWLPGVIRNVLIEYLDNGEKTVRPFRGLRIIKGG